MKSLSQTIQNELPSALPPAGAMLYGYVDTSETGYRQAMLGATTYTLASGIFRGDALAAQLSAVGVPTTHQAGRFTVTPSPAASWYSSDRLGVLMGLTARAGDTVLSAASHTSSRLSPVAIPLAGFYVASQRVDADDESMPDRLERDLGFAWGGARVVTINATLHKWALDAWLFGWCQRGRVTFEGSNAADLSGSQPGGKVTGHVIATSAPRWIGDAQIWAEISAQLAVEA